MQPSDQLSSSSKDEYTGPGDLRIETVFSQGDAYPAESNLASRGLNSELGRGLSRPLINASVVSLNEEASFSVENALEDTFGSGRHQTKIQILGVIAYVLGAQALNMMPFLQLYPALQCSDGQGSLTDCTRAEACANPDGYVIDWTEPKSLHNWMTEMDLICTDPAKIGIMGTIAFCSIGLGSILLGGLIDQIGRKKVLLGTLILMPCVQLVWLLFPSLMTIYLGLFFIGLCYSVRASVAYVYTTESLLPSSKLQFCVYQFMSDGITQATMSGLFWSGLMTWRVMVVINMSVTLILIAYLKTRMCDSPQYLYSTGRFEELKSCLENIARRNGCYDEDEIDYIIGRLILTKSKADAQPQSQAQGSTNICSNLVYMCKNTILRGNLISMCFIWAVSGFCWYLIDFYVKYFPGSVFFNKALFGLCDACAIFYVKLLESKVKTVPLVLRITLVNVVLFSLLYMPISQAEKSLWLVPLSIGMTRLQINAIIAYAYHVNQYLFPTLQRGAAYSITNFVSRPFIGLSTIITEYTSNPMIIVTILSTMNIAATFQIEEPAPEVTDTPAKSESETLSDKQETSFTAAIRNHDDFFNFKKTEKSVVSDIGKPCSSTRSLQQPIHSSNDLYFRSRLL